MLRVIYGEKGAGKSKRIMSEANDRLDNAKGTVVYIDNSKSYTREINYKIRFIDASEYGITTPKMFYGFICGISAQDFDLEAIYVDGFLKIVKHDQDKLQALFEGLEILCEKINLDIVISLTGSENESPDYIKKYI